MDYGDTGLLLRPPNEERKVVKEGSVTRVVDSVLGVDLNFKLVCVYVCARVRDMICVLTLILYCFHVTSFQSDGHPHWPDTSHDDGIENLATSS